MTPTPAEQLRYVFVEAPRCPACGSARHSIQRTATEGDGTRRRSVKCQVCRHNFILVIEAATDEEIFPDCIQPLDGRESAQAILGAKGAQP